VGCIPATDLFATLEERTNGVEPRRILLFSLANGKPGDVAAPRLLNFVRSWKMSHYRNTPKGAAIVSDPNKPRGTTVFVPQFKMNRAQRRRAAKEARKNGGGK